MFNKSQAKDKEQNVLEDIFDCLDEMGGFLRRIDQTMKDLKEFMEKEVIKNEL